MLLTAFHLTSCTTLGEITIDSEVPQTQAWLTPNSPAAMVSATLLLVFALLGLYVARKTRQYYVLKDFGGHWSAGWSRLWLLKTQGSGKMNRTFTKINKQHGKCILC